MDRNETRIKLNDSIQSVLFKMSGGNPGAITVLLRILNEGAIIDPDNALGGLGAILSLDTDNIYEEKIWMLYKDVCKEDIINTLAIIRAIQLGFIDKNEIHHAINNFGKGIDLKIILGQVQNRLPGFGVTKTKIKKPLHRQK